MQPYPGTNPVIPWVSFTFTTGYGIWPTPLVVNDADPRFAAQLMAAVQAVIDRTNLLGWRVAHWNPIDGTAIGLATHTAAIYTKNALRLIGACTVEGASGELRFKSPGYVQIGSTVHVGDTGAGGVGHVEVNPGSDITLDGSGGSIAGIVATGSNARIQVAVGALLQVTAAALARLQGDNFLGLANDASTSTTRYHPMMRSGTAAVEGLRERTLNPGDFTANVCTIDSSEADVWVIGTGFSTLSQIKVTNGTVNHNFTIRQKDPSIQGADVQIVDHLTAGILGIFVFDAGIPGANAASADYYHDGSSGKVYQRGYFNGIGGGNSTPAFTP